MEDWRFLFERICNNWKTQYWLIVFFVFSLDCWFFRFVALLFLLCFFKFHMVLFFFLFFFFFVCLLKIQIIITYILFFNNKIDGKLTITVKPGTRPPVEIIISKCYSDAAGESFSFFGMICCILLVPKKQMDFFLSFLRFLPRFSFRFKLIHFFIIKQIAIVLFHFNDERCCSHKRILVSFYFSFTFFFKKTQNMLFTVPYRFVGQRFNSFSIYLI